MDIQQSQRGACFCCRPCRQPPFSPQTHHNFGMSPIYASLRPSFSDYLGPNLQTGGPMNGRDQNLKFSCDVFCCCCYYQQEFRRHQWGNRASPITLQEKSEEKNPTSPKSVKLICTKQAPSAGMSLGQKKKEGGSCISRIKLLYSGMNGDPRLLSHIDSLSSDTLLQLMLRSIQKFRLKKTPHKT